jgi:hypothetical protein
MLILAATVVARAPASAPARHRVVRVPVRRGGAVRGDRLGQPDPGRSAAGAELHLPAHHRSAAGHGRHRARGRAVDDHQARPATPGLRILDIAVGGRPRVRGITLKNGATTTAPGGGIRNAGVLVPDHVTLTGKTASGNNDGALANTGRALVVDSVFAANATEGPVGNRGGDGIRNTAI